MIVLVFSLLPMVMIAWYFATNNKWKDISWEIRRGLKCTSCKEDIYTTEEEYQLWMSWKIPPNCNITTCKACKRDESIDILFVQKSNLLIKFRNYLISEKSRKLLLIMLIILIVTITIDVILTIFFHTKYFSIVSNSINVMYWVLMFIKRRYTSIKKPSH